MTWATSWWIEERTLPRAESCADTDIVLKREENWTKKKKNHYNTGYSYKVTKPWRNPDTVLSFAKSDCKPSQFFFYSKNLSKNNTEKKLAAGIV